MTLEFIKQIEATGAIVMSFISDGTKANVATAEVLGANLNEDKSYFFSPTHQGQKIYTIWDPPHMLKLVRKHFCEKKTIPSRSVIGLESSFYIGRKTVGEF